MTFDMAFIQRAAGFAPAPLDPFTITPRRLSLGSPYQRAYSVDRLGEPHALIAQFTPEHGGNWAVTFARSADGGRFATYEAAEAFARGVR